jgi:hypothetical protein
MTRHLAVLAIDPPADTEDVTFRNH